MSSGWACENASRAPMFAGAMVNGSCRKAHDFNVLVFEERPLLGCPIRVSRALIADDHQFISRDCVEGGLIEVEVGPD